MDPYGKVLTISRNGRLIGWLKLAYGEPPAGALDKLNFCELFWMTLASPFAAVLRPFAAVLRGVLRLIGLGGSAMRLPRVAEAIGERVAAHAQGHGKAWDRVGCVLWWLLRVATILYFLWALYWLGWWVLLIPGNVAWAVWGLWLARHTQPMQFLATGYRATKTRTCPRVEFKTDEP
jgi:hypothetical protein